MFLATFSSSASILKKLVDIVKDKDYIPEGTLIVSEKGIVLQSMDASHVALVDFHIRPEATETFECDKSHQLGINFDALNKIFKCSQSIGKCTLCYDPEKKGDTLHISFSENKKSEFELRLLQLESILLDVPDELTQMYKLNLDAKELHKIIKDLSTFSDTTTIKIENGILSFVAQGDSTNASIELSVEESEKELRGTYNAEFSLKYLSWFTRGATISDELLLALDDKIPLLMQFTDSHSRLRFFLAPKIEE